MDVDVISSVVTYITRAYCRMRGKDFARKVMSTNTHSLKQSRRPTLAAVSNPALYKAKRKINEVNSDVDNNRIEYLLFDTASGNISTEDKGTIDNNSLLEQ